MSEEANAIGEYESKVYNARTWEHSSPMKLPYLPLSLLCFFFLLSPLQPALFFYLPTSFLSLFLSSTASHYRLHYCSTQQVWHLWPPAWPAILTCCLHQLASCVGKGPPICLGCCQLLVMRRHPPNVIKSLKKNLKVPDSWKGVYNNILVLI